MAPPPPPPGPPPPPMMAPLAPGGAAKPEARDQLLSSIRHGTKLRKTVTVDKSAPMVAGKVSGSSEPTSNAEKSSSGSSPRMNGGPQPLAGLFAGGMPKLRPTGLGAHQSTARDNPMKLVQAVPPVKAASENRSAAEPTKASHNGENRTINRGPPPQPPPASNKPMNSPISMGNNGPGSRTLVSNKAPAGGHGKPNLAPRPPPPAAPNASALHASADKPSPPPKRLIINGEAHGRNVSRAQSMRSPRSPPVAPPALNGGLVSHLSQETLNMSKTGTLPNNLHGVRTQPGMRGHPRAPGSRPPPPPSRPAPPTTAPPPPPPHRACPAPPPPRMPPAAPSAAPPAPPARNSSMRNGSSSSLMSELEARFAFHNVREFPDPQPYRSVTKQYNTRIAANAKQQAPAPPPSPQVSTHLQLSNKMYPSHASQC